MNRVTGMRALAFKLLTTLALPALVSLGCATQTARPARHAGLCFLPRAPAALARPLRPHDWVKLLVRLELGRSAIVALRDCTGRTIQARPRSHCPGASTAAELAAPVPIHQGSVIERNVGGSQRLLWIVSHRFANGDGFGPLAFTRRVPDGIEVAAMGYLRMRMQRVNLELWRVQHEAVVVASGETCAHTDPARSCQRAVRLLVHRMSALIDAPLTDHSGRCLQEPLIELNREQQQPLASGLQRRFELTSAVSHDARQIVLEERLVVRDSDPSMPLVPPREVQRIEANRFIRVSGGRLFSQQHPLWSRALPKLLHQTN
jgi:hypothetical protein